MKRYSIYTLAHPITLEVVYVGQTSLLLNDRLTEHYLASFKRKTKLYVWIKELRAKSLAPVITLLEECSKQEANSLEKYWISTLRNKGVILLNETNGGAGLEGFQHSLESKEIMRQNNLGKILSKETKVKMSTSTKNKIGGNNTKVIDESTGIIYNTIREAADALGINKSTLRVRIENNQGNIKRIEQPQYKEPKQRVRNHKNQVIDITTGITYESGKEAAKALNLNYNTLKKLIRQSKGNIITLEEYTSRKQVNNLEIKQK